MTGGEGLASCIRELLLIGQSDDALLHNTHLLVLIQCIDEYGE